jgi:hypothetical protein
VLDAEATKKKHRLAAFIEVDLETGQTASAALTLLLKSMKEVMFWFFFFFFFPPSFYFFLLFSFSYERSEILCLCETGDSLILMCCKDFPSRRSERLSFLGLRWDQAERI